MLKIGIFTDCYDPGIGGIQTSIKMLKSSLENLGHQVYIFTSETTNTQVPKESFVTRIQGIKLFYNLVPDYKIIFNFSKYLSQIKLLKLDIIHIHTEFSMSQLGLYVHKKLQIPAVYTMHTMHKCFLQKSHLPVWIQKLLFIYIKKRITKLVTKTNITIVPTKKILILMQENYQIPGNYKIIPTGLNLTNFYQENLNPNHINTLKNKLNLQDFFVCLYVGRLSPEKEINYLIDAFATLNRANSQTKFLIIGDGPEKKNLSKQAKKLGISDKVIFLGFIPYEQLGVYYQLGDVFINASLFETQGLTYIEALAASLPLIVRYDQVLSDIVKDGQNGFFYYQKDELVQHLIKLSHSKELCVNLSNQARQAVIFYSQENFGANILKLYLDVVTKYQQNN
ncbi:glycosyltransferase [Candidatus Phytoplasma meliae]|uniref:Glycosyltransferase n=1 Tax=Candidatus Phytoplasma meliae TaxID=1848402 RepID=A0ABS5CXW6_9MOLU|nr:glycosyltransferase [Candidatus Phytoplasma meliae]MBP5835816.1 glycosyltransferase [Candidatus Phytoplasma meliae]